ncbi:MAG: hypothetical protein EBT51_10015 [Flavobacteriaceae bacterium]|nr:hypothetical protein [Flavobacteriaceae bacterium]
MDEIKVHFILTFVVQTAFEPSQIQIKPKKAACQYLRNIYKKPYYVPICEKVYQKNQTPN